MLEGKSLKENKVFINLKSIAEKELSNLFQKSFQNR